MSGLFISVAVFTVYTVSYEVFDLSLFFSHSMINQLFPFPGFRPLVQMRAEELNLLN